MDEENKRININDLPRAEEELTDEEIKAVQGGLTKVGGGTLTLGSTSTSNTIGGALSSDLTNATLKQGDGSV